MKIGDISHQEFGQRLLVFVCAYNETMKFTSDEIVIHIIYNKSYILIG